MPYSPLDLLIPAWMKLIATSCLVKVIIVTSHGLPGGADFVQGRDWSNADVLLVERKSWGNGVSEHSVLCLCFLFLLPHPRLTPTCQGSVTFLPHFPLISPDNHTQRTPHWGSTGTDEILVKALRDSVEIDTVEIGTIIIHIGVPLINRLTEYLYFLNFYFF